MIGFNFIASAQIYKETPFFTFPTSHGWAADPVGAGAAGPEPVRSLFIRFVKTIATSPWQLSFFETEAELANLPNCTAKFA